MDYWFVSDELDNDMLEDEKDDDEKKSKAMTLVTYDGHKKACWALQADKKWPTDVAAKWCTDRLEDSGCVGSPVPV